jgi:hypothetical protein
MTTIKKHDDDENAPKLINQGSYGCIYYPSLPFKLQKNTPTRMTSMSDHYMYPNSRNTTFIQNSKIILAKKYKIYRRLTFSSFPF